MPTTSRSAASSGQTSRRSSRASVEPDPHKHRREKTKSSQSYLQTGRRESIQASSGATPSQRPGLKSRAHSAPLVPKAQQPRREDEEVIGDVSGGEELSDDEEIADDPFFQQYGFPPTEGTAEEVRSGSSRDSSSETEGPLSPTQIKGEASAFTSPRISPRVSGQSNEGAMQDINIGVLGAHKVGKSTFVQKAFDLPLPSTSPISTKRIPLNGTIYSVRLVELQFEDISIGTDNRIRWPDTVQGTPIPRIDGAFTLYDVMNRDSLAQVPEMLTGVNKVQIPGALVSCKCDNHPAHREVDPAATEQRAKSFLANVITLQTSGAIPDSYTQCLNVLLKVISSRRLEEAPSSLAARRRANSSAVRLVAPRTKWTKGHERASSEYSGSQMKAITPGPYDKQPNPSFPGNTKAKRQSAHQTFLDLDESPGYDSAESDTRQTSEDESNTVVETPSDENGYNFDQLVDRLVAQPVSKADNKFQEVFLALYRVFASPTQLLSALIRKFEQAGKEKDPQAIKSVAQLRYLSILERWMRLYPGDFAYPTTRQTVAQFVSRLAADRLYSVAGKEMTADLEAVHEDDDTHWACCDRNREQGARPDLRARSDTVKTFLSNSTAMTEDSEDDMSRKTSNMTLGSDYTHVQSVQSPTTSASRSTSGSTVSSSQTLQHTVDSAQRAAKLLAPLPRVPLSKIQWHLLMDIPEETIAKELTRMDWIMFSSIRPRDLVRHVSLKADQKKHFKALENVNRMIEHFNHLAYFVSNLVLLRDKPKHRSLMLEKFMKIARKLREMNNYYSLGALLAGINGTAVHRLQATRELVPPSTAKDFMKLEILMGTQKSHFAYRLAWENSSGERIPYLPLLRRDLVSASEANPTFISEMKDAGKGPKVEAPPGGVSGRERINWRKFEIMGEVIVGMQRAQSVPYTGLSRNEDVKSLVLDVRIQKDDEELYERSVAVEPSGAAGPDKRKFNFFSR